MKNSVLRSIPSVDELLSHKELAIYQQIMDVDIVTAIIRKELDGLRKDVLNGNLPLEPINKDKLAFRIRLHLDSVYHSGLKKIINATGIPLHTNLGRAPLSAEIRQEFEEVIFGYCNLEYDIAAGQRGLRHNHLKEILQLLTGAEDVLLVNNNAAAVMLVLDTMAKEKEVIVSRGELVEVGGSFRIPKVMEHSGAILKEVGSTNKTHLYDYEEAISEQTAALMKVHTSNFRQEGFTANVSIKDLVNLGMKHKLPIIEDLGSGVLVDLRKYGLQYEPTVQDSLNQGADIVTFSGDKLLGGPQCGIIVGKSKYIEKMKKNQLLRALRVDKLIIASLTLTLKQYLLPQNTHRNLPVLDMLSVSQEVLYEKARKLAGLLENGSLDFETEILETTGVVGGGSLPGESLQSYAVAIYPKSISVNELESKLRLTAPHIIGRIQNEVLLLDVRTILGDEPEMIAQKIHCLFDDEKI